MKIKISDLVIKVINREEMPKELLFNGDVYKWCNGIGDYRKDGWGSCLMIRDVFGDFARYGSFYNMLFEDVEIIEEPKKIEKITVREKTLGFPNGEWTARNMDKAFAIKINELIDEVNNLKEND